MENDSLMVIYYIAAGLGLSATYTSLLTWLLSLVPDHFPSGASDAQNNAPIVSNAPFSVLGLQQIYLDGQLVLYVAIKPLHEFDSKMLPQTVKKTKVRL